jgi:hypothetical protein
MPTLVVWLSHGLRGPGSVYERGEAQEGFVLLEVAVPFRLENPYWRELRRNRMGAVVIGMDPHKRSATIEVMAGDDRGNGRRRDSHGRRSVCH